MKIDINDILNTLRNDDNDSLSDLSMLTEEISEEIAPSFFKEAESEVQEKEKGSVIIDQLDLDTLKSHRKIEENNSALVINSSKLKFDSEFVFYIKSVKRFSECVSLVELVDEKGVLEGSCNKALESVLIINSIIKIKDFSVWRINKAHINLVEENIIEIIN
ncbi:hypothetical protein TUBRATIS_18160 [Tubulinosema ratisbonensis]|uniref:Uncharacterized protein n=1 Tax=Tubulinosema ratisbonensis TaxID=291195 RepID=A0A437AKK1_9MICR|nr:hypothetical protein TUBRATIS_18160 [Tubulinosema ratisbonensis]